MVSLMAKLFVRCIVSKIPTFKNFCVCKHVTCIGILTEVLFFFKFFTGRDIYIYIEMA